MELSALLEFCLQGDAVGGRRGQGLKFAEIDRRRRDRQQAARVDVFLIGSVVGEERDVILSIIQL